MSALAKGFASDRNIDGGSRHHSASDDGYQPTFAPKTIKRLNRQRAEFVGLALENGWGVRSEAITATPDMEETEGD